MTYVLDYTDNMKMYSVHLQNIVSTTFNVLLTNHILVCAKNLIMCLIISFVRILNVHKMGFIFTTNLVTGIHMCF